ncbi:MAG: DUF3108 domain-containing protein [Bacteroidetes bacterium]|nr:MAG: DUF3108 domain-containing protein [Bacteroidota bacterium]
MSAKRDTAKGAQHEKRKIIFLVAMLLLVTIPLCAQPSVSDSTGSEIRSDTIRKMNNRAFSAGEYLKFEVNYGFVTAGDAVIATSNITHNGKPCYKVDFIVDSKPFFDWIYKVRDRYSTYIDSSGIFPWHFEQHIREGTFSRDFTADFDQINHVAYTTEGKFSIPPYVHDMLSAFFYARVLDYSNFNVGDRVHLQNFYKDSTYALDVKYRGKQQVETKAGTFNCIVVEPLAREGGLFKSEGKVLVWLTDDERKIPVLVSTKVLIGSIDAELVEYSGINGPIRGKVED